MKIISSYDIFKSTKFWKESLSDEFVVYGNLIKYLVLILISKIYLKKSHFIGYLWTNWLNGFLLLRLQDYYWRYLKKSNHFLIHSLMGKVFEYLLMGRLTVGRQIQRKDNKKICLLKSILFNLIKSVVYYLGLLSIFTSNLQIKNN